MFSIKVQSFHALGGGIRHFDVVARFNRIANRWMSLAAVDQYGDSEWKKFLSPFLLHVSLLFGAR